MLRSFWRCAAVLLAVSLAAAILSAADVQPAPIGQRFPEFRLPALQGGEVSLESLKGKRA